MILTLVILERKMNRFNYLPWDNTSELSHGEFKDKFLKLEDMIEHFSQGRSKALALTSLEECYMWIGKMIRDDQSERTHVKEQESVPKT